MNEQQSDRPSYLDETESLPGVDDLLVFYESLEEIYRLASAASAVYEENGLTTSSADIPLQKP